MLGLGLGEILLIAVVTLLVIGPDKLPQFMRTAGKLYGQFRRMTDDMRRSLVLEADRQDADERYSQMQQRRKRAEEARKRAEAAVPGGVVQDPIMMGTPAPTASPTAPAGPVLAPPPEPLAEVPPPNPQPPQESQTPTILPAMAASHATEDLPAGISIEEWLKLPPHIRTLLLRVPRAEATKEGK